MCSQPRYIQHHASFLCFKITQTAITTPECHESTRDQFSCPIPAISIFDIFFKSRLALLAKSGDLIKQYNGKTDNAQTSPATFTIKKSRIVAWMFEKLEQLQCGCIASYLTHFEIAAKLTVRKRKSFTATIAYTAHDRQILSWGYWKTRRQTSFINQNPQN